MALKEQSTKGAYTEVDLIKLMVKEMVEGPVTGLPLVKKLFNDGDQISEQKRSLFKLYMRIWIASIKFIKSQCDKQRLVDFKYFGNFYKSAKSNSYIFIPHQDFLDMSKLRLVVNSENQIAQPKDYESKQVQVNYLSIAAVCECKVDLVVSFLVRFREIALETLSTTNVPLLQLNFRIGMLTISKQGQLEFKLNLDNGENVYGLRNLSEISYTTKNKSNQQTLETNLKTLQGQQAMNNSTMSPQMNGHSGIVNAKNYVTHMRSSQVKSEVKNSYNQQDKGFNHLKDFLQSQQNYYKSTIQKDSLVTSPQKINNQIIDQISSMKKQNLDRSQIREKANKYSFIQASTGANSKLSQRNSVMNHTSYNKEAFNTVYTDNNIKTTNQQQQDYAQIAQNRSFINNATLRTGRHIDLSLSPNSTYAPLNQMNKTHANQWGSPESKSSSTIGRALERKSISLNYHQGYPVFLKSNGPFNIYNHHKSKGEKIYENNKKTKLDAKERLQGQLNQLRVKRESEKEQFNHQLLSEEQNYILQQNMKKLNNMENKMYLQMQMEHKKLKNKIDYQETRVQYHKPHFGPEETEELSEAVRVKHAQDREKQKNNILNQIKLQQLDKQIDKEMEKLQDCRNLETFMHIQDSEEKAKRQMMQDNKLKLKKAWQEQMKVKQTFNTYDKIFK